MRRPGTGAPTAATVAAALALAGWIGLSLSACRAPMTYTVTIDGMRYNPESLTVAVGDSVTWVNKDPFPHTATSKAGGLDSQVIAPDTTWTYTVRTKGELPYVCAYHPTMRGTLRVE